MARHQGDLLMDPLRAAAAHLDRAVAVEGTHPEYHRAQVARLRTEWPELWAAIEDVRRAHRSP